MKITLIISLFILGACGKKSPLIFNEKKPVTVNLEKDEKFFALKNQVIIPHCIKCHKKADTQEGIAKWIIPQDPEASALYMSVKEGRMPKKANPLPTSDLEFIREYIMAL